MLSKSLFISFFILLSSAWAMPIAPNPTPTANGAVSTKPFGITAAQIIAAVPSTVSCNGGGSSGAACRNATQIAPLVNKSFSKFGFLTRGEQAAIFALMAFESGNFLFDVNVSLDDLVKAVTRNMMMFDFVLPYALQYNRKAVRAIRPDLGPQSRASDVPDDAQKNAIRATVLDDTLSFASAAWFLRTHCSPQIALGCNLRRLMRFNAYIGSDCIGAGQDPTRLAVYQATLTAMGAS